MRPANDSCEAPTELKIVAGEEIILDGTIRDALDDHQSFCDVTAGSPEVVYGLQALDACTLTVEVWGPEGFDPALSVRSVCKVDELCVNASADLGESYVAHADPGVIYFLVSDQGLGTEDFRLRAYCAAPACGDGVLNAGEACDDGGIADGDGCDAACAFEVPAAEVDTCSGASGAAGIVIGAGQSQLVPADVGTIVNTINATDSGTGSCMAPPDEAWGTFPSPDHVYRITPSASGDLTIRLGYDRSGDPFCGVDLGVEPAYPYPVGCYDRSIHVREASCEDSGMEIGCVESWNWWMPEELTVAVTAGVDYYVFVDGWLNWGPGVDSADVGEYVLDLRLD